MFTSKPENRLAANDYLNSRWGLEVYGNVVVVRHANRNLMRVTNLQSVEHQLVDYLIVRYVLTYDPVYCMMVILSPAGLNSNECTRAVTAEPSCHHLH